MQSNTPVVSIVLQPDDNVANIHKEHSRLKYLSQGCNAGTFFLQNLETQFKPTLK